MRSGSPSAPGGRKPAFGFAFFLAVAGRLVLVGLGILALALALLGRLVVVLALFGVLVVALFVVVAVEIACNADGQLARYFNATTTVKVGVVTNGTRYRFRARKSTRSKFIRLLGSFLGIGGP